MKIVLYSTHCPKCNILTKKLDNKNIKYEEVTDIDEIMSKGYMSVPILEIDEKSMNYTEAIEWINKYTKGE